MVGNKWIITGVREHDQAGGRVVIWERVPYGQRQIVSMHWSSPCDDGRFWLKETGDYQDIEQIAVLVQREEKSKNPADLKIVDFSNTKKEVVV